jgi:DNA polymerase-3 subunit delta'
MKFSEIVGKQDVINRLLQSVHDKRISHAQLFAGYEGHTGLALAMAYAAFIHCENPSLTDSCGECRSCIKHRKMTHPDLHYAYPVFSGKSKPSKSTDFLVQWREAVLSNPYLDVNQWYEALGSDSKQGFMSVEESSDIQRKLSLKPYEAEYKILIVWLPEKMRVDASNKLLKILEEPPDKTLFILVSEHREQLLSTILSRTQLIKIPLLTVSEIAEGIMNKMRVDAVQARRIANLADGRYNVALTLAGSSENDFRVENDFIMWMRLCYNPFHEKGGKHAWHELNNWIENIAKAGREYQKTFLGFCLEAGRECMLVNHADRSMVRFDDEVIPNFSKFTRFIHEGNIAEIAKLLNRAHYAVERNANAKILFLDLSFKMNQLLNIAKP